MTGEAAATVFVFDELALRVFYYVQELLTKVNCFAGKNY